MTKVKFYCLQASKKYDVIVDEDMKEIAYIREGTTEATPCLISVVEMDNVPKKGDIVILENGKEVFVNEYKTEINGDVHLVLSEVVVYDDNNAYLLAKDRLEIEKRLMVEYFRENNDRFKNFETLIDTDGLTAEVILEKFIAMNAMNEGSDFLF